MPATSILVCFAMKEEPGPFRRVAAGKPGVDIVIVGIGRENAERSIRKFFTENTATPPDLVLTCGFAGGLNPDLKIGDVVFESGKRKAESGNVEACLLSVGAKPMKFLCTDHIATTVAEKTKLRQETGADVVEMESAAIQAVCAEKNIPCVTVRVISDTAHEDLPLDFNALAKPDKSLDFGKLAWAIARSPGKIGALMALSKKTSYAARQLSAVLEKVISA